MDEIERLSLEAVKEISDEISLVESEERVGLSEGKEVAEGPSRVEEVELANDL